MGRRIERWTVGNCRRCECRPSSRRERSDCGSGYPTGYLAGNNLEAVSRDERVRAEGDLGLPGPLWDRVEDPGSLDGVDAANPDPVDEEVVPGAARRRLEVEADVVQLEVANV